HTVVLWRVPAFATVEERQQIGMLQLRRDLDLAQEPLGAEHYAELRLQHLQRDFAVVLQVMREIDGRHAALAEHAFDAVPIGQGAGERVVLLCAGGRDVVWHTVSDRPSAALQQLASWWSERTASWLTGTES